MPSFIPTPFHCELVREDGHVRVLPHGELDMSTVPTVEQRLREALDSGAQRLVVDLRGLDFIDSTGLRLLVRWAQGAQQDGYDLALVRGEPHVHRLFTLTGLQSVLPFAED